MIAKDNSLSVDWERLITTRDTNPYTPAHSHTLAAPHVKMKTPDQKERDDLFLLFRRLRFVEGEKLPFDHISVFTSDTVAALFIVMNGKPVMLEDDPGLYPSDKLVTAVRLLIG